MGLLVVLALVGIVVVAMRYFQIQGGRTRMNAVSMMAGTIGFEFSPLDTYGIAELPFSLFRQGSGRTAENVVSGTHNNLPLKIFDYEYYIQGRNREYHRFTCAVLMIPAACPWLCLTHENALTRLGDHIGLHDVELEYDEFNRRFRVNCEQKFAFTMLDGQMMEWLLGADAFDRVEVIGPWIMLARQPLPPAAWTNLGNWLDDFHTHIPPVVYSSYPPR